MSIHLWHGLQQGPVLDSFKKIVEEYNISHSDTVELTAFDNYGKPATEAFAKSEEEQPSLVLAPEFQTSMMTERLRNGLVTPINQLLEQVQLDEIADIVKKTFGDVNGNLSSLPFNPSCGVIFTNQDMLSKNGMDPNWTPKSLEELEAVCKELQAKKISAGGWTCAWPAAYLAEVPASQQDFALVSPQNGKLGYGEYQLSKQWLINHFLDLRKQQKEGIFVYAGQTNDARKPFIEGKVAFFMQGSTHDPILQTEASKAERPFKVGCGALPTLTRGQQDNYAFPMGGAAIWALNNKQTQHMVNGVKEFLTYLATKEVQERWHKETAYVPVRKSLPKELEEYYKNHPVHKAVVLQTIEATLGNHSFGIHAPNWADARKELFNLIEKILSPDTQDDQVEVLLKEFDAKYSIPEKK